MDFIIVEDHELVREGATKLVEEKSGHTCAGKCKSIEEAVSLIKPYAEKGEQIVCLVDINLGDEDGLDLIKICSAEYPNVFCIAYTMFSGSGIINQAIDAGAKGYVSKNADISELVTAFDKVIAGGIYIEANLAQHYIIFNSLVKSLTKRELAVFNMILQKKSTGEIADNLEISIRTAENYFSRIYDKLGVRGKDELIAKFG